MSTWFPGLGSLRRYLAADVPPGELPGGGGGGSAVLWTTVKDVLLTASLAAGFALTSYQLYLLISQLAAHEHPSDELKEVLVNSNDIQREVPKLNRSEALVWNDVVFPHQIKVDFDQIGGLDKEKELIYSHVVLPFRRPELFSSARSRLLTWPSGILLYGPPGTGKTMLAKAIARQSDTVFINLRVSSLFSKWVGETEKFAAAIFSLARKLAPAIIFIDELDMLFQQRADDQTELSLRVKAQFMTLWDGITGDDQSQVMVIGATNRPSKVDPAILRRLSQRIMIGMPDVEQRRKILDTMLDNEPLDPSVDLARLAKRTVGFSGSDLKSLCQTAARFPLDDFIEQERSMGLHGTQQLPASSLRKMTMQDFEKALQKCAPTMAASAQFNHNLREDALNVHKEALREQVNARAAASSPSSPPSLCAPEDSPVALRPDALALD
eukprot:CAMPEP_0174230808 /NCGR_PEP_ID=MMETSP0417-20130205/1482_1 /TAXON_ID=242541 /ORGANISM="Mayorella sp, Strain BSH-02190019" /LENGTH=438 /DNA_ID=CAMNT_0015308569 /DNA_START=73 /DNA_END=1389 /DNA_ORIENTATION=+